MVSKTESNAGQRPQDAPPGAGNEPVAERIHHLFRQVGDNGPARELEQQVLAYRQGSESA